MKTVFKPVTAGAITKSLNGGNQVELRQIVTKQYDDSSNLADALFEGSRAAYDETRVTWRNIGENDTVETVTEQLAKFPEARLRKFLSHQVIMSDGQDLVYKNGFTGTKGAEAFADFKTKNNIVAKEWDATCKAKFLEIVTEAQLVKYGEGSTTGKPGDPILYNGKKQYKVIAFSQTAKEDIDLRIERAVTEAIDLAPVAANVEEKIAA